MGRERKLSFPAHCCCWTSVERQQEWGRERKRGEIKERREGQMERRMRREGKSVKSRMERERGRWALASGWEREWERQAWGSVVVGWDKWSESRSEPARCTGKHGLRAASRPVTSTTHRLRAKSTQWLDTTICVCVRLCVSVCVIQDSAFGSCTCLFS